MTIRIILAMALIALGLLVIAISIFGLFRLRDALERIHAGALTDTLGVLLMLAGLVLLCGLTTHTLKLCVLLVILWLTNPVSSHLLARMELVTGLGKDPDHLTGEGEQEL